MTDKPQVLRDTDDDARTLARTLLRGARSAAMGVIDPQNGFPSVSRVLLGIDTDGVPVILVSALSSHTAALEADSRASLLTGEIGKGDPLAHARLTLHCNAEKVARDTPDHARIRERFVRRQPKSKLYVDFPDFAFFRLNPVRASLNGGFGKAYALEAADFLIASPARDELAAMEADAIAHMSEDHAEAASFYAHHYCGASGDGWVICGMDAAGLDLMLGDALKRMEFPEKLQLARNLPSTLKKLLHPPA
ncbi:HugZ family pyridoxamine 5'-phosphate oxidase [Pararhizobium sp.]|uniref:HugZ family pyridoxamine 5'-phosphate oxidase n=1 Tax=Pararhizobium sp. TaxID=1977563 RepID=UPI002720D094|nr:DUF2470 domain-containing protein [Pararhizobium sp.]MDO9414867.1 pyridoxamine 5'-phosphate oxidase family protein [Pararhizobium sp.]